MSYIDEGNNRATIVRLIAATAFALANHAAPNAALPQLPNQGRITVVRLSMLRMLFIGLPALLLVSGIPLALKLVPPNRFYGFRTSTTFSSLDAWYQINFATGLALIAAGLVGLLSVLLLSRGIITLKPELRYVMGLLLTGIVTLLFLIPVVIYSNRF